MQLNNRAARLDESAVTSSPLPLPCRTSSRRPSPHLVMVTDQHQGGLSPALQLPDNGVEGVDRQCTALIPEITWRGE